ncbi:penton [Bottlenose dolphin adenovirus 1]|uniref:Penton protein n=1 Tax=Bottlenose dolphin adenovirus 1 TaxID=1714377 RepID=A0A1X7MMH8_9ADEN|nr:penton [Bottlenose dolphin adenovirus 1]SMG83444.1 penton [Bottlenose dolphin adenovirus 1]
MDRTPISPPPSYETAVEKEMEPLFVPSRYRGPSEGRNSIRYTQLPPLYDTTKMYFIDNKSADIASLNYQNDHSNFQTTIIQNADYTPLEASTQTINFDERSRWGGELKTILHTNMPNITSYMFSNSFKVKLMTAYKSPTPIPLPPKEGTRIYTSQPGGVPTYEWVELHIPEGNFSDITVIDLMNNAIIEHYLKVGRLNGVAEDQIGVKFDTRNFYLGYDPQTGLITPGSYTYKAFHPDIVLLPECAVDFSSSRLNNLLGIRKRFPFQENFTISYEDLTGGEIPALMDLDAYNPPSPTPSQIIPLLQDKKGRSYHVIDNGPLKNKTQYRSWYLAYNYGPSNAIREKTLLVNQDVTCGAEQLYWSLPDLAIDPVTFRPSQSISNFPVVGTELLPIRASTFYNSAAVYAQIVADTTNHTHVFNRFPENQILIRPPESTITTISENIPVHTDHGILPIRNSVPGVQRVTVTDARRRICPYIYKSLGIVTPRVLSSKTF